MKITICCSAKFFNKIPDIQKKLEAMGFEVFIPSLTDMHPIKDSHGEDHFAKIHYGFIRDHFKKIEKSDALLILNFDSDGIKGRVGGNTFIEMAKAFDVKIPIFLWNHVPNMDYREEILAMQPIIINQDLNKIKIEKERINQIYPEPTVGGVIIGNKGKIFMVKSPKWGNGTLWTQPGGHIEIGENWETAVKREIKEEVGFDVEVVKFLNIQQAIFPKTFSRKKHFIFIDFVMKAKDTKVKMDGKEIIDYTWVEPKKALEMKLSPYFRKNVEKYLKLK